MEELAKELKEHLASTPKEQLQKEFEELKQYNQFGPDAKQYIEDVENAQILSNFVHAVVDDSKPMSAEFAKELNEHLWDFV